MEVIEEIWELMMEVTRWSCYELRRAVSHKLLWDKINCIKKVIDRNKRNIWDPGKLQTMQQDRGERKCCSRTNGWKQPKVWDPRGLQQRNS